MSEPKWTKGPWRRDVVHTSVGVCHKIGPFPIRNGKENYACVYDDCYSSVPRDEELEANARLIASAPDLYEALEASESHLEELRDAWERGAISEHDAIGGTRSNRNMDLLIEVRKALAKARGEGPQQSDAQ